jgi:hypothetical protein
MTATVEQMLWANFETQEEADAALAYFKSLDQDALRFALRNAQASLQPATAEELAKRRQHRVRQARVDYDDPLITGRRRLPVTGMTLSAQAVTGQPRGFGKKDTNMNIDNDLATEAMTAAIVKQFTRIEERTNSTLVALAKRTIDDGARVMSRDEWHALITAKAEALREPGKSVEQAFNAFISKGDGANLFAAYLVEARRELAMSDPTITSIMPAMMAKAAKADSPYPAKTTMSVQRGAATLTNAVEDFMREYPALVAMGSAGRRKALEAITAEPGKYDPAIVRVALRELDTMRQADAARANGAQLQADALDDLL